MYTPSTHSCLVEYNYTMECVMHVGGVSETVELSVCLSVCLSQVEILYHVLSKVRHTYNNSCCNVL